MQSREDQIKEEAEYQAWKMGDYVEHDCPRCKRHRLCICPNGMHRCEKCNWCPELNAFAPVE